MINPEPRGHLFIIDGDLNDIRCDAALVPSSVSFGFSSGHWAGRVPDPEGTRQRTERERRSHQRWTVVRDQELNGTAVWIGNVGLDLDHPGPYVDVAVEFVRRAYAELASAVSVPRVALNVVGTGAGGMRGNKGDLVTELVGRLAALADELLVDIVLVTRGLPMYAACQIARQRLGPARPPSELVAAPDPDRLDRTVASIAESARASHLVLFVGAGVSMGAGLPSWQGLLDELAKEAELGDKLERLRLLDVRDQAKLIVRRLGFGRFSEALTKQMQGHYALAHGLLASLDPHEVVTTNYDTLMERAFGVGRAPAVLPFSPVGPDGRWLLKLHGTVDDGSSVVLTREDYLGLPETSQALFGIVQAMLMTRHMLFIGYSLSDDTFHRVVHDVRRAKARDASKDTTLATVLTLFQDPVLEELWKDELDIVPVGPAQVDKRDTAELIAASRSLDIVLDCIAREAADVSTFLLDPTYDSMLPEGSHEQRVKQQVEQLVALLNDQGPIDGHIRQLLAPLLGQAQRSADR